MESKNISSPINDLQPCTNYDELLLRHSLLFADSLKDLRNVKDQLYSAAEHFEDSYYKNDHKQLLLESLKDYVSKSLIKTIDHLGSVTYKVNNFLHENVNGVSRTKLQVLCFEQRLRTCRQYTGHDGLSQQSLLIPTPKYHKKYLVPDGHFSEAIKAEKEKAQSSVVRNGYSGQASTEFPPGLIAFSFREAASNKGLEKRLRSISPLRFPIKHSGSAANLSTSPSFSVKLPSSFVHRSISSNSSSSRQQHPSEAWRSHSLYPQRERTKDIEVYSKKTQNLFKAMLSIHKSKNNNS